MEEDLKSFLEEVSKLFLRFGIRSVTMDDIARELGISKKTIYTKIKDKTDLVEKVMDYQIEKDRSMAEEVFAPEKNAIDEQFDICQCVGDLMKQIHPSVMFDLQKYYPEVWQKFRSYKQSFVYDMVKTNLKKGKKQGWFRANMNEDIIAKVFISKIDVLFDSKVFDPQAYSFFEIYIEMMIYHIQGVASFEGSQYLEKKLKEQNLSL